jgi:hypothetical protein
MKKNIVFYIIVAAIIVVTGISFAKLKIQQAKRTQVALQQVEPQRIKVSEPVTKEIPALPIAPTKAKGKAQKKKSPEVKAVAKEKPKYLSGIDFLTGFGWGKLKDQGKYQLIPFKVAFNFDFKHLFPNLSAKWRPLFQFQVGPYLAFIYEPHSNAEIGTSFSLKLGLLPETSKFQPYIKAGTGMVYMTQHTREQSTQFNFIDHGGLGMHYFFNKEAAFTLEGCYRHLSNAGIDHPNHGINTYFATAGITKKF